ncbi:MBL fold metallo-hydrolase [Psychrobacter urativorans]|uniref:MBL fold metallo-hydrolase n=1 Tax=Psychrobacter urativorans TaxID=45610 RepID=UPI00191AFCFD|nr:MBL fold metallo-hydrolase [Psychrobacter urativorans]
MNSQQGSHITPPDFGEVLVVSNGILWTRFKIPSKLDHINIYLIRDGDGWFVIDSGPASDENRELWKNLLQNLPKPTKITGILITHCHPDHIGLAGWLQDYCNAPLYISEKEILQARLENRYRSAKDYSDLPHFYKRMAASAEDLQSIEEVWEYVDQMFGPLPTQINIVKSGDTLVIGGESWRLWSGSGHSIEHICLQKVCGEVMISGDQIIAHITPYVGLNYMTQEADPLAGWIAGLSDMLDWIDPKALVLPSHNKPFYHGEKRVREVLQHHQTSLDKLRGSLEQWRTVNELSSVLGWAKKQGFARCLALEETYAHVTYLVNNAEVICETVEPSGVLRYRLA